MSIIDNLKKKTFLKNSHESEDSIVGMLKAYLLIAVGSLAIISIFLGWENLEQKKEQEKMLGDRLNILTHVNHLNNYLIEGRILFQSMMIDQKFNEESDWAKALHLDLSSFKQEFSYEKLQEPVEKILENDFQSLFKETQEWAGLYSKTKHDIENQNTLKNVYRSLSRIQKRIILLESEIHLETSRLRRAFKKETQSKGDLATKLVKASYKSRQISKLRTSFNSVKTQLEKMAIEYKQDNLLNIRENYMIPALTEFYRTLKSMRKTTFDIQTMEVSIQLVGQDLFGNNFDLFSLQSNNMDLNGGFYKLRKDFIDLNDKKKILQLKIDKFLGEFDQRVLEITEESNSILEGSLNSIIKSFQNIWNIILIITVIIAFILILLGYEVLKRVKKQLQSMISGRNHIRAILNNMWDGLVTLDENGIIVNSNPAVSRIFGNSIKLSETNITDLIPGLEDYDFKVEQGLVNTAFEMDGLNEHGELIPMEFTISKVDSAGTDKVYALFIRDISGTQRLNEAKKANEMKSSFLANMSHEIRTPMNGIIATTYQFKKTKLDEKQKKYLRRINSSSHTLLNIINDILDFSKIEAGKLTVESVPFSLDEILTRVADVNAAKAGEQNIEFIYSVSKDVPRKIIGDGLRLNQILLNFASNAIKFTSEGEIVLTISLEEKIENKVILKFSMRDTGIGMTEEQVKNLFNEFSQADSSITREYGGTGLGLSICKKLVELMDGKIGVNSKEGYGSTFWFTLPLIVQENQNEDRFNIPYCDMPVLVVDDNELARESLQDVLESFSIEVETANSGIAALEKINQRKDDNQYSIVFMDWKMPQLNGMETIKKVISDPDIKVKPKFIMVTAYGRDDIFDSEDESILDGFINKPVTPSIVHDSIASIYKEETVVNDISAESEEDNKMIDNLRGAKVLLVEDNEVNQELAIELLEDIEVAVTLAENGIQAIEKAKQKDFDLILMDMQMPVMDGIQASKILRSESRYDNIPIIALSANAMVDDIKKCKDAGMEDHISKPINVNILYNTMAKWIKNTNRTVGQMSANKIKLNKEFDLPNVDGINYDVALKRINGKTSLYKKMLNKFYINQKETMNEIYRSWEEKSFDDAILLTHTLKGISGNIGADLLHLKSSELESILKAKEYDKFSACYEDTKEIFDKIMNDLEDVFKEDSKAETGDLNKSDIEPITKKLEEVRKLLSEDDRQCVHVLENIEKEFPSVVGYKSFIKLKELMEFYAFENALIILAELTKEIKEIEE